MAGLKNDTLAAKLFSMTIGWYVTRVIGAILAFLTLFKIGPEIIYSGDTGGTVLVGLLPTLIGVFLFAGMLLPLLMNFGLLEFVGTLMTKIMRPLFTLPGRSAVDSMASWLGDGSVGIMMTNRQYEEGHYTKREGIVVATTFSTVSITFSLVVLAQVKLEHLFLPFYLTVCASGLAAALITPRIPPLSLFDDTFIDGRKRERDEEVIPKGYTLFGWAWHQALERADKASSPKQLFRQGIHNVADLWVGVLPVIMAVGTIALVVATTTPIFGWMGKPFIPLLKILQVPEAVAASKTLILGFADMFVPSILASSITADMTRFIIAAVSVTQLIYLSEVGALILGGKLPVNIWQLFAIFLIRTLVTLPVICIMAHCFF